MAVGGKGFTSQTFTSNGTFTVPAGVTQLILIGAGGGAGGCGGTRNFLANIPGGNGVVQSMRIITVVPNTTYTITIGAGGAGATGLASTGTPPSGGSGGTTSFGVLATFPGATGGLTYSDPNTGINRYASGFTIDPTSFYQTAIFGSNFASGTPGVASGSYFGGSGGGAGINGVGGNGGNGNASGNGGNGSTATSWGGGGGAGGAASSTGGTGGNGGPGFLQVIWVEA